MKLAKEILENATFENYAGFEMMNYKEFLVVFPHHDCEDYVLILDEEYASEERTIEEFFPTMQDVCNYLLNK